MLLPQTKDEISNNLAQAAPNAAAELVAGLRPAVRYATRRADDNDCPLGSSKIGGDADLADGSTWPAWLPGPLRFFMQISLDDAHACAPGPLNLPSTGLLSFFADFDEDGNGITGLYADERAGCRVIYTPRESDLVRHSSPLPALTTAQLHSRGAWTWPTDVEFLDDEFEALDAWDQRYEARLGEGLPPGFQIAGRHQLAGHSRFIQHPFEEEVVQAVEGCYSRSGRFDQSRWLKVKGEVKNWRTLMQLDSDSSLAFMWGDVGTLYWGVRKDDIARGDWSRAMFNFQCS